MTVLEESSKTVIDRSMTILRQSLWELVKAENHWLIFLIMDIPLMAKCHLPQSMTKIYGQNFKKNVIDDGQWQKNCHLLKGIYPGPVCLQMWFFLTHISDRQSLGGIKIKTGFFAVYSFAAVARSVRLRMRTRLTRSLLHLYFLSSGLRTTFLDLLNQAATWWWGVRGVSRH